MQIISINPVVLIFIGRPLRDAVRFNHFPPDGSLGGNYSRQGHPSGMDTTNVDGCSTGIVTYFYKKFLFECN
jgi:hypothetical protein